MFATAGRELRGIFRNEQVLVTAVVLPVLLTGFFAARHGLFSRTEGFGHIAALALAYITAIGLFTTVVTTLVTRRQTMSGNTSTVIGLLLPITTLVLVETGTILTVLGAVTGPPANPALLIAVVASTFVTMLAVGLAVAGPTQDPQRAQAIAIPIAIAVIAVAAWVAITGTEELTQLKRFLPGGAAAELALTAWNGGPATATSWAPALGWTVVALALATSLFRWKPRR